MFVYVLLADDHVNNVSYFPFMSIKKVVLYFCVALLLVLDSIYLAPLPVLDPIYLNVLLNDSLFNLTSMVPKEKIFNH
jgi:hypothetical protein